MIALIVVNLLQPGAGINADPATLDAKAVAAYASSAQQLSTIEFILNIIPTTLVDAFARGEILQVLLVSVLFGLALLYLGEKGRPLVSFIEQVSQALFGMVGIIMRVAPIGAFGAMAFTIGTYGIGTLLSLGKLMGGVLPGVPAVHLRRHGRDRAGLRLQPLEVPQVHQGRDPHRARHFLVRVGAAADHGEARAPRLRATRGGARRADRLLDEPRRHVHLHGDGRDLHRAGHQHAAVVGQQLGLLAVLLLTSKGAAGVTGSGFVTLAATLSAFPDACRSPGWRCSSASTASCRKRARSRT